MKNNYHTHTFRCGHALGSEKDMVEAAMELGLKGIGFSDHIPYPILYKKDGYTSLQERISKKIAVSPGMRMSYGDIQDHLDAVKKCKKEYPQITIYQGFEAEYFPLYKDYYRQLLETKIVDYLILGHHYYVDEKVRGYYGRDNITDEEILQYGKEVVEGLETGFFSYLAHPDLFMQGSHHFTKACKETSYLICRKAKELNIPLEINAGRINYSKINVDGIMTYLYPNEHFWKIASEIGNQVVIGLDAHKKSVFNHKDVKLLEEFASKHHLQVLEKIEFKKG